MTSVHITLISEMIGQINFWDTMTFAIFWGFSSDDVSLSMFCHNMQRDTSNKGYNWCQS